MRSSKMQIAKRPYYKICFIDTLIRTRKLLKYQAEEYEIICSMDIFDLTAGYEEKQKKLCLAKVKINTIKHIGALSRGRRIGFDEADNPEGEREDEGNNGQQKVSCQPHYGGTCAGPCFRHILCRQLTNRLDPDHSHLSLMPRKTKVRLQEHLIGGM